ncbi:MAG: SBBP repeat-containing protein, partial [Acidimicrobiia bacterium]
RQFGSGGAEVLSGVAADGGRHVTVAGSTRSSLPGQTSAGEYDAFVRRFDADGNDVWTHQFGSPQDDFAVAVALGPGGDVVVTGGTSADPQDASALGSLDAFVRRFDHTGTELWARQFGSAEDDYGLAVSVDPAGNAYVAGSTDGALPGQASAGLSDAFVRMYDARGAEVWARQFGTAGLDDAEGVAVGPEGRIAVTGRLDGTLPRQQTTGGPDVYVTELDGGGREQWMTRFGSDEPDYALGLALDGTGGIYVTGGTLGTLGGQGPGRERDAFLASLGG